MNKNHPVYHSLVSRLESLKDQYRQHPCERNRYRLVRQEQLMAQWVQADAPPEGSETGFMGASLPAALSDGSLRLFVWVTIVAISGPQMG